MTKNITRQILTLAILGCIPGIISAQEVIVPPGSNPLLKASAPRQATFAKAAGGDTLSLPLLDEFSMGKVKPDPDLWSDDYAFINNNFPLQPPSNGVATLDALDENGSVYNPPSRSNQQFSADTLSSHPIRLDLESSDSIYLSFFYQPAGLGDDPEESDSLLLEFYRAAEMKWEQVWGIPGRGVHSFRQVMIPITDTAYLHDGFRFRFRNLVSLSENNDYPDKMSNVDLWHLDYIRLDRDRFAADTVLRDVAFVTSIYSVLKDLSAIPWSHFEQAFQVILDPNVPVRYLNNDTIPRNLTRSLFVEEPMWGTSFEPTSPTAQDLGAGEDTLVEFPNIFPGIDLNRGDSAILRFKAALRTDEFDLKINDTVIHDQLFSDFYAYDDGSHEAGYGLRGSGSANGMVALRYHAYRPDLIGGVDICFNRLKDSVNLGYYFNLMVWNEQDESPGSILLEDGEDHLPFYASKYPGFVRYYFTEPVAVDGPFYVGWKQFNEYNINFGLDLNSITDRQVMFYNLGMGWFQSEAPGALMIRPFLYDETVGVEPVVKENTELLLYPNPADAWLNVHVPEDVNTRDAMLEIFDASGRLLYRKVLRQNSLDVSFLDEGLYHLRVGGSQKTYYAKLLVRR